MILRPFIAAGFAICVLLQMFANDAAGQYPNTIVSLDGNHWQLAADPQNVGRDEKWFLAPRGDAKATKSPCGLSILLRESHLNW